MGSQSAAHRDLRFARLVERAGPQVWDEYLAFVVRAETATEAREILSTYDPPGETWTNHERSTCVRISANGPPEVILSSFKAG